MLNRLVPLAGLGAFLFAATAHAADPAAICESSKLLASSKYAACLLKAEASAAKIGGSPDISRCAAKLASDWPRIEGKAAGQCPSTGDQTAVQGILDASSQLAATAVSPADLRAWCKSAKLLASAKYISCLLKADSKAVKSGSSPDTSDCEARFASKWLSIETKAAGQCPSDQSAVKRIIDGSRQSVAAALSGVPSAPDLDVAYIERTPRYYRYDLDYRLHEGDPWPLPRLCAGTENLKRWPDVDEVVTYTAHVINKGESASAAFAYKWRADGITVEQGMLGPLGAGEHAQASLQRRWPAEPESLQFVVEDDVEVESSETNNALAVGSHDLTLSIRVEQGLYDIFNRTVNVAGTRSFEDWIQGQLAKMNERFGQAVYPVSPAGILDRVRIDRILVEPDLDSRPPKFPCQLRDDAEENLIDGHWQFADGDPANALGAAGAWQQYVNEFASTIDWGLIHELTHQLGIIDLYRMNLRNDPALNNGFQVTDLNGDVIAASRLPNFGFDQLLFQFPGIMAGGSTEPYRNLTYFESHTAGGLNSHYNYRRGYFGEYLFDTPATTYLKVVDAEGTPLAGVAVQLYQKSLSEDIDDIAEITGTTDGAGRLLLPNREVFEVQTATGHTLKPNPFGQIFHEGQNGTMFVRAIEQGQELYGWIFLLDLNLAYWQGVGAEAEILVTVVPPR